MDNADGSVIIEFKGDVADVDKEIAKLKKKIGTLQEALDKNTFRKNKILDSEEWKKLGAELDAAKAKLQEMKDAGADTDAIQEQREIVKSIQSEYNAIDNEIKACDRAIQKANTDIEFYKEKTGQLIAEQAEITATQQESTEQIGQASAELGQEADNAAEVNEQIQQASEGTDQMAEATKRASGYMDTFVKRVSGLIRRAFVFSLITSGLRSLRTWLWNVIQTNDEAKSSIAKLKGALLTLVQPLVQVIIPAFTMFVKVITAVVSAIATFVSAIFGTTAEKSADAAESLYDETKAIKKTGSAAKEASKDLASFDEINKLSASDASESATGAGADSGTDITPDFSDFKDKLQKELAEIAAIVGAALLAIGAILAFSGINIPLGIALMALGAATLAGVVMENWDAIKKKLQGPLGVLMALLCGFLLVIGAILVFSGANIPLGIGLMIVGALGLAAVVAANWDAIKNALRGPLGVVFALLCGFLLVIGAMLVFTGANIPLGIGLMIAGAVGLAAVVAINWDTIQQALQGPIGSIVALLSTALLVIGAVLLFSGANIPLGLGMMIAGSVGLAMYAAANWDTVSQYLQGSVGAVLLVLSTALLVIGAALLFSGANIPLGLGLVVAGAVGMAATIKANWKTISTALKGTIGTITALLSVALLAVGAVLLLTGAAIPLGLGMMAVGAIGLAATIAANWDTISDTLGGKINAITAVVSAALLVLGVILLFTGAAIPLGIGLIATGAVGLAMTIIPNWDFVLDKVKNAWSNLKKWWKENCETFFTAKYWENVAASLVDGFLDGLWGIFEGLKSWASDVASTISDAFSTSDDVWGDDSSSFSSGSSRMRSAAISTADVPALARGAVIPPNREFMAVLGDQKSGTNIETPLATMVQAFRQALSESGYGGANEAVLMLDKVELGKVVYTLNKAETNRVGVSLAGV